MSRDDQHCTVDARSTGIRRPRWIGRTPRLCEAILQCMGATDWELSLLFCGDDEIAALNGRYLGKEGPTDVMSFSQQEKGTLALRPARRIAGDIVVSLDALARNARAYRCSQDEELKRLLIHGILHLAGMDHGRGKGRSMRTHQERLVRGLRSERIISTTGGEGAGK